MLEIGTIRLRAWENKDLEHVYRWENDFETMLYSRGKPENAVSMDTLNERYDEDRKNEKRKQYIVEHIADNKAIGTAVIRLDDWGDVRIGNIGTYLDKEYWNHGIGKVITLALLDLSFYFMNLDKCDAYSIEYNKRAHKVLESCGFKRSGIHRKSGYVLGRRWDWYYFDILREEYMAIREKKIREILGTTDAERYISLTNKV